MSKQNDGRYLFRNYFDTNILGYYPSETNPDICIPVSPYVNLLKEDFVLLSNIDYDIIYNSFLDIPDSDEYFQISLFFILEMLSAYDELKEKDNALLQCTLKLTDWLLTKNVPYKSSLIINRLQIIRRTRTLSDEENAILFNITRSENDNTTLAGAYILLGNSTLAKQHYELLSLAEKEEFDSFPINIFRNFDI